MDNLYFKKLPSDVLPTIPPSVNNSNVVIVETQSGKLMWIDSSGAKELLDVDKAFPVGTVLLGENSPASAVGGTWTKISDYLGTPARYLQNSGFQNVSPSQEVTLATITIPANSKGIVTGFTQSNVPDSTVIMNAQIIVEGEQELNCRTTMANGGGCSVSYTFETASSPLKITLLTYGYRAIATPIQGILTALFFELKPAWKRTA